MSDPELSPGDIAWVALDPVRGREQGGHSQLLVVASAGYLDAGTTLVIGLPITGVDRQWPNHVAARGETGLDRASWVMTEQPRTLFRERITRVSGSVSPECLAEVRLWLGDFLDLRP